jgi:hypothetical protein
MAAVSVSDIAAGATETSALASGIGAAFTVAAVLTTLGVVLALMVPYVRPAPIEDPAPSS